MSCIAFFTTKRSKSTSQCTRLKPPNLHISRGKLEALHAILEVNSMQTRVSVPAPAAVLPKANREQPPYQLLCYEHPTAFAVAKSLHIQFPPPGHGNNTRRTVCKSATIALRSFVKTAEQKGTEKQINQRNSLLGKSSTVCTQYMHAPTTTSAQGVQQETERERREEEQLPDRWELNGSMVKKGEAYPKGSSQSTHADKTGARETRL